MPHPTITMPRFKPLLVLPVLITGGLLGAASPRGEAQDADYSTHFRVFTGDGKPATLEDIVRAMGDAEAVMIGEIHTDPVGHWVEAELFRRALEQTRAGDEEGSLRPLALSMEMFERDVQGILDEYLQGLITESQFLASARPWEYYQEDYRPMVEAAKAHGVPVIAANAPRRYVNRVSRLGRDALFDLPPQTRAVLPPLPYPQPTEAYRAEWTNLMSNMTMEDQCPPPEVEEDRPEGMEMPPHGADTTRQAMAMPPHRADTTAEEQAGGPGGMPSHGMGDFMENGLQAQTLWDSSMGYAIASFLAQHPGALVVHVVGGFHVENSTGTPEKVQYYRPGTRNLVVSMQTTDDFTTFDPEEFAGKGDFVVLTDKSLDKNYERNCTE
jgi:uncharacterized iron-regulated protein